MAPTQTTTRCRVVVANSDGMIYPLTACCSASGKGSADSPTGVVCRSCYQPVSAVYGDCGWAAVRDAVAERGCPCPQECADHTVSLLEAEADPYFA